MKFCLRNSHPGNLSVFGIAVFLFLAATLPSAVAQEAAGVVEKMLGSAARQQGAEPHALATGSSVFAGDTISTSAGARLRIRFLDDSILTLGEDARLSIDEVVYIPAGRAPEAGEQTLRFVKGVFQYVSGKIGHGVPEQVALNTPVATIGIRGTRVIAGELQTGMPPGQKHYGFQILEGAVVIAAPLGSVTLNEPGQGTFLPLAGGAPPTPVRQWTAEEASEAAAAVAF